MGHLFNKKREAITNLKNTVKPFPYHRSVAELFGPTVEIDGKQKIFFSSNDRLGLASDPRVREKAAEAARRYGMGLNSHFLGGRLNIHDELETTLAEFVGCEKALVFNSGYLANIGILPNLADQEDVLIVDKASHACIIDGYNLSHAEKSRFLHSDAADLDKKLSAYESNRSKLVVVEGVYSVHGDICPLDAIHATAQKHGASLMIDDAHGIGVLGPDGRGTAAHFGLTGQKDILIMGTFNKSLGSIGGFIAGDRELIEYLQFTTRSYIFTAAISPPLTAAVNASLAILKEEPFRIERVWNNAHTIHTELGQMGYQLTPLCTPIIHIKFDHESHANLVCQKLFDEDVFAHAFVPPAVDAGTSAIRLVGLASHTDQHIDQALNAFKKVFQKL